MNKFKTISALIIVFTTPVFAFTLPTCETADDCFNAGMLELVKGHETRDPVTAIMAFDKAIQLKSDYIEAYYNRGYLKQIMKTDSSLRDALVDYNKILEFDSEHGRAYFGRALVKSMTDTAVTDIPGAIADFDTALRLDPTLVLRINYYRGITKSRARDTVGANKDLNQALSLVDESEDPHKESFKNTILRALEKNKALIEEQIANSKILVPAPTQTLRRSRSGGGINYSPAQREAWMRGEPVLGSVPKIKSKYNLRQAIVERAERRLTKISVRKHIQKPTGLRARILKLLKISIKS